MWTVVQSDLKNSIKTRRVDRRIRNIYQLIAWNCLSYCEALILDIYIIIMLMFHSGEEQEPGVKGAGEVAILSAEGLASRKHRPVAVNY